MTSALQAPSRAVVDTVDQRVVFHGVSWAAYESLLTARGERSVPRITFLRGELEVMSPSHRHEQHKKRIAALVEAYLDEREVEYDGIGSWTLRRADQERGLEPDECYIFGDPAGRQEPDLAIEVEWTAGGLDKLDVYRGLGVREVWIWRKGRIEVFGLLRSGRYRSLSQSALLPDLDLARLTSFLDRPTQSQAVRGYRAYLRKAARSRRA